MGLAPEIIHTHLRNEAGVLGACGVFQPALPKAEDIFGEIVTRVPQPPLQKPPVLTTFTHTHIILPIVIVAKESPEEPLQRPLPIGNKSFTLTDEEEKALLTDMEDIFLWVKNLVENKVRQVMDRIIEEQTEYNPRRLTPERKREIIAKLKLKTAVERNRELEEELRKEMEAMKNVERIL